MKEITLRNFITMLTIIGDYREKKIDLRRLVDSLEGSIDALEDKLPEEFYLEWHKHWNKLEVVLALGQEGEGDYVLTELKFLEMLIEIMITPDNK